MPVTEKHVINNKEGFTVTGKEQQGSPSWSRKGLYPSSKNAKPERALELPLPPTPKGL